MRKYLIFILLLIQATNLYSQVRFEIIELNVSQITTSLYDSMWIEGEDEGPYIKLKCALYNQSDKDIYIYPPKSDIKFLFNKNGVDYENEVYNLGFISSNDSIMVKSNDKIEFFLYDYILLGTDLLEEKKEDYKITLIGLLPTLRVHYKDTKNNFFSSRIWRVNIL